ncbi:hypothetical protein [Pseudoxanthobacter sp.]|uniref:HPr kinase/phosphorylase n=1 Tax=Pseudoxanthobacter sp. TaxID=1925742 RepID=UPI002FE2A837
MSAVPVALHGTALAVGETGVLIRGPSGAGKTTLALDLIETVCARGGFAILIGDDRVRLAPAGGRLIVAGEPALAGFAERRGLGVVACAFEPAAVLGLVVDLVAAADVPRVPAPAERRVVLAAVTVARLAAPRRSAAAAGLVLAALGNPACAFGHMASF